MSVHIARSEQKPIESGGALRGSPEELEDTSDAYFGYFGTYTVDENAGTVTHHIEGASHPDFVGTDQRRFCTCQGDHLVLSTCLGQAVADEITYVATWERQSS